MCQSGEIQGLGGVSMQSDLKTDTLLISPVALESEADMILLPALPSPHSSEKTSEPSSHQPMVTEREARSA